MVGQQGQAGGKPQEAGEFCGNTRDYMNKERSKYI